LIVFIAFALKLLRDGNNNYCRPVASNTVSIIILWHYRINIRHTPLYKVIDWQSVNLLTIRNRGTYRSYVQIEFETWNNNNNNNNNYTFYEFKSVAFMSSCTLHTFDWKSPPRIWPIALGDKRIALYTIYNTQKYTNTTKCTLQW